MEAKKKITHLGGKPGQNKATVTEEERSAKSEEASYARALMKQAGELFMPEGATYCGSASVHYYSKETIPSHPSFFFVVQKSLTNVNEAHAGLGIQALRAQTMEAYGHAAPKTRDA